MQLGHRWSADNTGVAAVRFTVNTLQLASISPASGVAGTSVTFTGAGFGSSQGSGVVWLGSTAGQVLSWTDTQVVAAVAPGAVTGIARVQQNAAWSRSFGFIVPVAGGNTVMPALLNMVVGDTHTIQALSPAGQSVTGLNWACSDTTVVNLSTDNPPILTALAAGHVTITAGTASADVTVSAGALVLGTVIWSNPGDGSGVTNIVPAVPSTSGVADVFASQNDATVQAIASDGTTAWTADVSQAVQYWGPGGAGVVPDFQGGLVVLGQSSIWKLDGITGQAYPAYTPDEGWGLYYDQGDRPYSPVVVHPDGTIFAIQQNYVSWGDPDGTPYSVIGIDPITGTLKFSLPLPTDFNSMPNYSLIIAGDGYAYLSWELSYLDWTPSPMPPLLRRLNSTGAYDDIQVSGGSLWWSGFNMITNADQGVLLSWVDLAPGDDDQWVQHMAITTGTSVSVIGAPQIPGQGDAIVPVLQAQDGSFVGYVADGNTGNNDMIAFDATGNVRWVVPNDQPQIATADGGVIGQSGITYDQNGNATGQVGLYTQSWRGYMYTDGLAQRVSLRPSDYAFSFAAVSGGNPSGSGTDVRPEDTPQRGMERLSHANLTATPACNALLGQFATIGNVTEATLIAQLQATANRAFAGDYIYDGPSSTTPLDPAKFPGMASAGIATVGQWFDLHGVMGDYAEGLSQFNGDSVWVRFNEWFSWLSRTFPGTLGSYLLTSSGHLNSYAMGTLMHEILHKQTVGGGFSHPQMDTAITAVLGYLPTALGRNSDSLGIGQLCFGNLQ